MKHVKELRQYAQTLSALYVEDNRDIRENTQMLFNEFFKSVDIAVDGVDGLEKYNQNKYDIVITDINMPKMSGTEMIEEIKEINPEQKIITITAYNEPDILIDIVKKGVSGFILKPISNNDVITTLYPVCRDAYMQNLNIELVHQLNEEKAKLEEQYRALKAKNNTIDTKHQQLEKLLEQKHAAQQKTVKDPEPQSEPAVEKVVVDDAYFAADEDEGKENVILISDDCDELLEIFTEIPELLSRYDMERDRDDIVKITADLTRAASVMFHYAPYLDVISHAINELSTTITDNMDAFTALLECDTDSVLTLFDAVSADMERYVERFRVESMAMHNIHHIHQPTALSIQQIVGLIVPGNDEDYGELEFF